MKQTEHNDNMDDGRLALGDKLTVDCYDGRLALGDKLTFPQVASNSIGFSDKL